MSRRVVDLERELAITQEEFQELKVHAVRHDEYDPKMEDHDAQLEKHQKGIDDLNSCEAILEQELAGAKTRLNSAEEELKEAEISRERLRHDVEDTRARGEG